MVYKLLQRIPEFTHLPIFELRAMAERAHVLCIPRGRWLVYPSRELPAYLYLAKGHIETFQPTQIIRATGQGSMSHFYPGCAQARALRTSQILRIDAAQRDFLINRHQAGSDHDLELDSSWLYRFIRSCALPEPNNRHMAALQKEFIQESIPSGAQLFQQGDQGNHCFVIERGHAIVERHGQTVAHLGPGDAIGEDALISGQPRSATVSALDNMIVHRIEQSAFQKHILNAVVQFVDRPGVGELLNLGEFCLPDAQPFSIRQARDQASKMDPRPTYFIVGASQGERALCAFLLIRRGFNAAPLRADLAGYGRV